MHQSIPAAPRPPPPPLATPADPRKFILPWMTNSHGWGLLSCQIPRGGDEKRGQMPRPPSALQHFSQPRPQGFSLKKWVGRPTHVFEGKALGTKLHFSLIAQSNSAVLSILMCNFFVSINVFLCNSSLILIKTTPQRLAPVYHFSIDVKLLTLKLIECCKVVSVMNSFINMKGCFSNNINRNLIQ